jgi:transcriptional regulator with XRE-family HTH domain
MVEIGQRLRRLREKVGKSPAELASEAGLSAAAYYDLEVGHDWYTAVCLKDLDQLAKAVGATFGELLSGRRVDDSEQVKPEQLRSRLQSLLRSKGRSVEDFENQLGWEINSFLENPASSEKWNVDCLRAVCNQVGVKWYAFSLS